MKLTHYLSIFVVAAVFASCTKEGPAGPQGDPGLNGNANVSANAYAVYPSQWISNGNGGWYVDITPVFNPTQGAVSILYSTDDANWFGLPYVGNTVGDVDINYVINSSSVEIEYVPQTGSSSITSPANTVYVQITLIPAAIQVKYPNVNFKNSTEVLKMVPEVQAALTSTKLQ